MNSYDFIFTNIDETPLDFQLFYCQGSNIYFLSAKSQSLPAFSVLKRTKDQEENNISSDKWTPFSYSFLDPSHIESKETDIFQISSPNDYTSYLPELEKNDYQYQYGQGEDIKDTEYSEHSNMQFFVESDQMFYEFYNDPTTEYDTTAKDQAKYSEIQNHCSVEDIPLDNYLGYSSMFNFSLEENDDFNYVEKPIKYHRASSKEEDKNSNQIVNLNKEQIEQSDTKVISVFRDVLHSKASVNLSKAVSYEPSLASFLKPSKRNKKKTKKFIVKPEVESSEIVENEVLQEEIIENQLEEDSISVSIEESKSEKVSNKPKKRKNKKNKSKADKTIDDTSEDEKLLQAHMNPQILRISTDKSLEKTKKDLSLVKLGIQNKTKFAISEIGERCLKYNSINSIIDSEHIHR